MASAFTRTVRRGKLAFAFRASPVTNVAYMLDGMAGLLQTPPEAFLQRWNEEPPGMTRADTRELARWRDTQRRHLHSVSVDDDDVYPLDYPLACHHEIQLGKRMRIASFEADDLEQYRRLLSVLTTPKHVQTLVEVAAHFLGRYQRWWDERLAVNAERFVSGFEAVMTDLGLFPFVEDVARFYEAELPDALGLRFHFVMRTDRNGQGLHGEQIENHSIVEIFPSQDPKGRVDVVLHELFHYFFASAPRDKHKALLRAFAEARDGAAWGAYNLLDESVAAALGNGLVGRATRTGEAFAALMKEERALYGNAEVDKLAKALMPSLERRVLSGRGGMHERFVPAFLEAARATLGPSLEKPRFLLWTMLLVADRSLAAVGARLASAVEARSVYEHSPVDSPAASHMLEAYTHLSCAVLVRGSELRRIAGFAGIVGVRHLAEMEAALRARPAIVYGVRRSPKAFVFVLAAHDDAGFQTATDALVAAARPFEGLLGAA